MTNLFQSGAFRLHSGEFSGWKIECDALTDKDIATFALIIATNLSPFGSVEGIPRGGLRLAAALQTYCKPGDRSVLVVDDVLTTGASLEEWRLSKDHHFWVRSRTVRGAVMFARGKCPSWVWPVFQFSEVPRA